MQLARLRGTENRLGGKKKESNGQANDYGREDLSLPSAKQTGVQREGGNRQIRCERTY